MRKLFGVMLLWFVAVGTVFASGAPQKLSSLYDPAGNTIEGNPKGSITIVEFFDYNCGYCRMLYPQLKKLVSQDKALRLVFRDYPILSEHSMLPVQAALAAQKQGKYLALHDVMLQASMPLDQEEIVRLAKSVGLNPVQLVQDMHSLAIETQVKQTFKVGQDLNIQGVPTFIVARTNPPSRMQPEAVVGPSLARLKEMIQQAKDAK